MPNRMSNMAFALAAIATVLIYVDMAEAIVEEGLISYWTFDTLDNDDIEGETIKDVWGDNHGTMKGGPKVVQGKFGEALKFDGKDDYALTGLNTNDLPEVTTFVFWMNTNVTKRQTLISGYIMFADGPATRWDMEYNTQKEEEDTKIHWLEHEGRMWSNTTAVIKPNEWTHVVVGHDSGSNELDFYINGVFDSTHEIRQSLNTNQILAIAARPGGTSPGFFGGMIDELCVYGRALSADAVRRNFASRGFYFHAVEYANKLACTWGKIKASR